MNGSDLVDESFPILSTQTSHQHVLRLTCSCERTIKVSSLQEKQIEQDIKKVYAILYEQCSLQL